MQIKLYNSLTKFIEEFKPLVDNTVRMYSCGPTVYNYAHIGNMRSFLFADLLARVLKVVGGYKLRWVMNITNIDDKTIRDSSAGSSAWLDEMGSQTSDAKENLLKYTLFYENSFFDDIAKLGIKSIDFYALPRATDFIPQMQDLIKKIVQNGFAYISNSSVYFNVSAWREADVYGKLFHIDFEQFRDGVRIDADQYEREQASDFVLWKAKKPGEPSWDFELNGEALEGRPGWHIECSAMEKELLGLPFDIHTGGIDLKFPHHEDEIAQSKAGYGVEPTAFWCHNEFLEVEGQKMSKSLGNFFTLRDLIEKGIDPLDIRYSMLSSHYSSIFNFTVDGLMSARKARFRIQDYIYDLFESGSDDLIVSIDKLKEQVFFELASDLHSPKALAHVFYFINRTPATGLDNSSKADAIVFFNELNKIFDVWEICSRPTDKPSIPPEIEEMAKLRLDAKNQKNFAESDRLRNAIQAMGFSVKDTKDGYILERI